MPAAKNASAPAAGPLNAEPLTKSPLRHGDGGAPLALTR